MNIKSIRRIGLIGFGAMGQYVIQALTKQDTNLQISLLLNSQTTSELLEKFDISQVFFDVDSLLQWQPDLVVECAGHSAVINHVPTLLEAGINVIIASIGILADIKIHQTLLAAAEKGNTKLILVSGAVGGLDALRAAKSAGLSNVHYIGRKPPKAWKGSIAENEFDLEAIKEPTIIFQGTATEAAIKYPKNANVTAAVALSGLGFDGTTVVLMADPLIGKNIHEVNAKGEFGELGIKLSNNPLPINPRTSWLAALSIEEAIIKQLHYLTF